MKAVRDFARRIDVLADLAKFVDDALVAAAFDEQKHHSVQFAIEELMTNMVKYAPDGAPLIRVEIACEPGIADVLLIDTDVDRFDPSCTPDARTTAPLIDRQPGGLGLHLVRRLVDGLHYTYDVARREGRTSFRMVDASSGRPSHADD